MIVLIIDHLEILIWHE